MRNYRLMHRDVVCGSLIFDEQSGNIEFYRDLQTGHSPFLGNANENNIKHWWKTRAVPASRSIIQNMLKQPEGLTAEQYLEKNLALSITDSYWVCPVDFDIRYDQVRFTNLSEFNDGKIPYHNATSYDPNASLGGQMEKYWDLSGHIPVLVKESYRHFGQQAINELFATKIHECLGANIPYTAYTISGTEDRGIICRCNAFTSDRVELVPAIEVVESKKSNNDISVYDHYINIAEANGIPRAVMQVFLDYQTITDFIISNTDEHLMNFGVLRDPVTLAFIGPAPIFDSGDSMFYSEEINCAHTRRTLLEQKITAVHKSEEQMLAQVKNKGIVDTERLPNQDFVIDLYTDAGIPEEKATCIAHNYALKVNMVRDLQRGIQISLYNEKIRERNIDKYLNDMQGAWHGYMSLPPEQKDEGIPWGGENMRVAVFDDKYLALCKEEGHKPDPEIYDHFWENCVGWNDYEPQFCVMKKERIDRTVFDE